MLFSGNIFLIVFLPIVLFCYFVLFRKSRKLQNVFLLIASLVFYAWGEPKFVFIMMSSIVVNWLMGYLVDKYRDKKSAVRAIMTTDVIFNLGLLFVFKYLMFTVENINSVFGTELRIPEIALPIGISFFTFQAMSYVIDVYRKDGEVQKNLLNVGLYISLFPQLIAGPIVRYQTVADEIMNRRETLEDFTEGVRRFIIGFLKKVLLANTMAIIADGIFDSTEPVSTASAWLGLIAYTFQIYYDFSGYSDMGIGLGRMFGFHFLENFNYPYISLSVSDFWRRWHISLGTWFRDYVYFPLGGSRVSKKSRLIFNLFAVWFLTGVWHGANWTFIIWGLMYFVLLVTEKLSGMEKKLSSKKFIPIRYIYTMFFVCIGWMIFRASDITAAGEYFKALFGIGVTALDDTFRYYIGNYAVLIFASALFSVPTAPYLRKKVSALSRVPRTVCGVLYVVAVAVMFVSAFSFIVKGSYNPFIYFNF